MVFFTVDSESAGVKEDIDWSDLRKVDWSDVEELEWSNVERGLDQLNY